MKNALPGMAWTMTILATTALAPQTVRRERDRARGLDLGRSPQ